MLRLSEFSRAWIIVVRAWAWGCIVTIAILSLMPAGSIERTDLGGRMEHVLAYAGTAAVAIFAYRRLGALRIFCLLTVYAACLEYLQHFSPGRTPNVSDFLFSATGITIGMAVGLVGWRVMMVLAERLGANGRMSPQDSVRDSSRH